MKLFKISIAVTYRCNSRCVYCNIWKMPPKENLTELNKNNYDILFSNLDLSWLHLTGGEPFLRNDFKDIVISASNKMENLIVIDASTNGLLSNNIVEQITDIVRAIDCNFEIGVSIDGPEEIHNSSRGLNNSWQKAMRTFKMLKSLSEDYENFHVHVNHFISPTNINYFNNFIESMEKENVAIEDISLEVGRQTDYFNNILSFDSSLQIINRIDYFLNLLSKMPYENLNPRHLLRSNYLKHMKYYLKTGARIPCAATRSEVFIDPYGQIYPCSYLIKEPLSRLDLINYDCNRFINSIEIKKCRKYYKNCEICWSGCEGITSLIQNFPLSIIKSR